MPFLSRFPASPLIVLLSALMLPSLILAQEASLDDIIESHVKALGGKEAIAKIENFEMKAKVNLDSAMGALSGTAVELVDLKGKRYYNNFDLGQFKKMESLSGDSGWRKGTEGDRDMTAEEIGFAKMNIGVCPLLEAYETAKGTLKLKETALFNGKQCHVIALGPGVEFFVNVKTHLLDGMKLESIVAIAMSDYESVGGVTLHRTREISTASDGVTINYQFTSAKTNIEIDDSLFGDAKEASDSELPVYTAEQIIGFLDKDDDEKISKKEAKASPELSPAFASVDSNKDGFIDMQEAEAMVEYTKKQKPPNKPDSGGEKTTAKQIVASMDKNKDGKIDKAEASPEFSPFFDDTDTTGDGFVDEKEAQAVADFVSKNQ